MVYLDNSATTVVTDEVAELICSVLTRKYGNPSAQYFLGAEAYNLISKARSQVAGVFACSPAKIFFTSGGTESNNLAILGCAAAHPRKKHIVTTAIEHESVLNACAYLENRGYKITYIKPDKKTKCIKVSDVVDAVDSRTLLVSCMSVNNETGDLLPLKEIVEECKKKNPELFVHSDCVQGYGKVPLLEHELKLDLVSGSAHKIHGPKGVGFLYIGKKGNISPFCYGGKQEGGIHPGTENTSSIAGFGLAAEQAVYNMKENLIKIAELRKYLIEELENLPISIHINSPQNSLPYILNFSIPEFDSVSMIKYLSSRNIYVSSSSACNLGQKSHVLIAKGYPEAIINSSLRVSMNRFTRRNDIDNFLQGLKDMKKDVSTSKN